MKTSWRNWKSNWKIFRSVYPSWWRCAKETLELIRECIKNENVQTRYKNRPKSDWFAAVLKRNPELRLHEEEAMSNQTVRGTDLFKSVNWKYIFSCDETSFCFYPKDVKKENKEQFQIIFRIHVAGTEKMNTKLTR